MHFRVYYLASSYRQLNVLRNCLFLAFPSGGAPETASTRKCCTTTSYSLYNCAISSGLTRNGGLSGDSSKMALNWELKSNRRVLNFSSLDKAVPTRRRWEEVNQWPRIHVSRTLFRNSQEYYCPQCRVRYHSALGVWYFISRMCSSSFHRRNETYA